MATIAEPETKGVMITTNSIGKTSSHGGEKNLGPIGESPERALQAAGSSIHTLDQINEATTQIVLRLREVPDEYLPEFARIGHEMQSHGWRLLMAVCWETRRRIESKSGQRNLETTKQKQLQATAATLGIGYSTLQRHAQSWELLEAAAAANINTAHLLSPGYVQAALRAPEDKRLAALGMISANAANARTYTPTDALHDVEKMHPTPKPRSRWHDIPPASPPLTGRGPDEGSTLPEPRAQVAAPAPPTVEELRRGTSAAIPDTTLPESDTTALQNDDAFGIGIQADQQTMDGAGTQLDETTTLLIQSICTECDTTPEHVISVAITRLAKLPSNEMRRILAK